MAIPIDITERQKMHLTSLLKIKKSNVNSLEAERTLNEEIISAVAPMSKEDAAWCEKVVGVKAL